MNTGHTNVYGRTIYRGPRGGEYVLGFDGRKIRSFPRVPAAAPAAAPAGNRNILGRIIHRGPRGGEYVLGAGGRKIRKFTRATAAVAAPVPTALAKRLSKFLKLGNNEYINKYGELYNNQARMKTGTSSRNENNAKTRAFNMKPKFLQSNLIPYVGPNRPNEAFMKKHKLKNSTVMRTGKTMNGHNTGVHKKVYFNKHGLLYYLTLNGKKNSIIHASQNYRVQPGSRNLRQLKRLVGMAHPNYPRGNIPPATPEARRRSPELLENMMNQIYVGGRGGNVNAGRYTNAEKNVLARRLNSSIQHFKRQRDIKKTEAMHHRAILRAPGLTNAQKQTHRNQAAAANERVMYYDDAVLSYTRGLRALKPLTGVVTPRARAMPNTPNRFTPAPANVTENMAYANLNRPHLVVKTPGVGIIYLSPNTFRGLVKNSARVNIAPANVRNWLRMARRNFPNERLFRHPFAPKNVTASHIRFSRA